MQTMMITPELLGLLPSSSGNSGKSSLILSSRFTGKETLKPFYSDQMEEIRI